MSWCFFSEIFIAPEKNVLTSLDLQLLQTRPGGSKTDRQHYSFIIVLFSTSSDLENSLTLQAVFSSGRVGFHSHVRWTWAATAPNLFWESQMTWQKKPWCVLKRKTTATEISVGTAVALVLSADDVSETNRRHRRLSSVGDAVSLHRLWSGSKETLQYQANRRTTEEEIQLVIDKRSTKFSLSI